MLRIFAIVVMFPLFILPLIALTLAALWGFAATGKWLNPWSALTGALSE